MATLDLLAHLRSLLDEEHQARRRVVATRIEIDLLRSRGGKVGQVVFVVAIAVLCVAIAAFRRASDLGMLAWLLVGAVAAATLVALLAVRANERAKARLVTARPLVASCRRCGPGATFRLEADDAPCACCGLAIAPEAIGATILALDADCGSASRTLFELERERLDVSLYAKLRERHHALHWGTFGAPPDARSLEAARLLGLCYVPLARRAMVTDWLARHWGEAFPRPLEEVVGPDRAMLYGELGGRPILVIQTWRSERPLALEIAFGAGVEGLEALTFIVAPGARRRAEQGTLDPAWRVSEHRAGLFLQRSTALRGVSPAFVEPLEGCVDACRWLSRASHQIAA